MADLKLIALDVDDLAVISAHLQDAVLQVGDIAYLPRDKRFAAIANRFDCSTPSRTGRAEAQVARRRAAYFERVLSAQCKHRSQYRARSSRWRSVSTRQKHRSGRHLRFRGMRHQVRV